MTTSARAPRMFKGALVAIEPSSPLARVILFQYNPDTLTRTLEPQTAADGGERSEALRLRGAPKESLTLEVEIDATDQLETGTGPAVRLGIYPQLSALEMLIYPGSARVIANTALMALGTLEVIPPPAPLTLFIWGPRRIVPVRVSTFSINEQAFDVHLNPIRATVSLGLRILNYDDLAPLNPGYHLFLAHQMVKETMAVIGSADNLGAVIGHVKPFL